MSINFKLSALGAVGAALIASAAQAAPNPTLYGGGATLPAIAYIGSSWTTTSPQGRLTNPADSGSLFGAYTNSTAAGAPFPTVSYCQTGSGNGRKMLRNASGFSADISCGDYSLPAPNGFSAPAGQVLPQFVGSDAPLSGGDYSSFVSQLGATRTEPVQLPSVAGAIAIIYNNADLGSTQLTLTEQQLCKVWSGSLKKWNQIKASLPAKNITLVYRSDGSGTSFGFSNHLSAVCPTLGPVAGFKTTDTFSGAFPSTPPAGSLAASGNGGVVSTVQATDGAIGYAETGNALTAGVPFARLAYKKDDSSTTPTTIYKKFDPAAGLAATFNLPAGAIAADSVLNGVDASGRPIIQTITTATGAAPAQGGCVALVKPDAYATAPIIQRTKTQGGNTITYDDYQTYPIVAVTYLMGYNTGNTPDTLNLRKFFGAPYNSALRTASATQTDPVTTVGLGTGFAFLTNVTVDGTTPINTTITNCIKG